MAQVGTAKRAGEVERAGAGTDHQVQFGHDCCGICEVGDLQAEVDDVGRQLSGIEIAAARPDLQDDEVDIRVGKQRGNVGEARGADPIAFGGRIAGPDDADAWVAACDPLASSASVQRGWRVDRARWQESCRALWRTPAAGS